MIKNNILIAGNFSGNAQERKLRYVERLYEALQKEGYNLVVVNGGELPPETTIPFLTAPRDIALPHRIEGKDFLSRDDLPLWLYRAAVVEAEARQWPLADTAFRLLLYATWMREVLKKYRPALCLIWHQFNGPHHALTSLCQEMSLPFLYLEYGLLPGTISFDADGQMGESRITLNHNSFKALPIDERAIECAERMVEHIQATRKSPKIQDSAVDIPAIVTKIREHAKAVIFYAGQNDWGSGMLPRPFKEARIHSPIYEDTLDALNHLTELAEANDWHVLFKPHPLVQDRHKSFVPAFPNRMTLALGANIFDCIEHADICTTILSQASYLYLIHNRPCVLLGRHQMHRKECVYEISERAEAEGVFQKALSEGYSETQRSAFLRHVAQLCRYYLFAMDEDTERIMGRGIDAVAHALKKYSKRKCGDAGFPFEQDTLEPVKRPPGVGPLYTLFEHVKRYLNTRLSGNKGV